MMASKPGTVTVAGSVVTVTWGGSQAGSTVPTGSWARAQTYFNGTAS